MKKRDHGFTLVEVLLVAVMFPILLGMLAFMFQVVVDSWSTQGLRTSLGVSVSKATSEVTRDLRNARAIDSKSAHEIRYTRDGTHFYIYYLYAPGDAYPPNFLEASYQLRKATLSGAIDGTFTYGSGDLIARDILPPPVSGISYSLPNVTIDLTEQQSNIAMRSVSTVRARNL